MRKLLHDPEGAGHNDALSHREHRFVLSLEIENPLRRGKWFEKQSTMFCERVRRARVSCIAAMIDEKPLENSQEKLIVHQCLKEPAQPLCDRSRINENSDFYIAILPRLGEVGRRHEYLALIFHYTLRVKCGQPPVDSFN